MDSNDSLVEVYVSVDREWIDWFEEEAKSYKGVQTFEQGEVPSLGIYSKSKYEELKVNGGLPPNATIVLAKINIDDLINTSDHWDLTMHFEAENGKLRKVAQEQQPSSKPRLK